VSFDALPAPARERLERFAAQFERLGANEYVLFANRIDGDEDLRRAVGEAEAAIGHGGRRDAVKAAVGAFADWAAQGYSGRLAAPDTILLYQSLPDRAEDRVRFLASLERAIVAIVLWDELNPAALGALVGPWAEIVARATGT
jgi:hypothetical protein